MSIVVQYSTPPEKNQMTFTDAAAAKVSTLIQEEKNPKLMLRVFITGGGCSGFQYGFTFDEEQNPDDFVIEKHGVKLLVDSMSFQYLIGAEIDYKEDLQGSQFIIRNPNAKTTCGCGSSFSMIDKEEEIDSENTQAAIDIKKENNEAEK